MFNQSPDGVTLSSCLQTLTPDYVFNLSLEDVTLPGVTLPSSLLTRTVDCMFNLCPEGVTLSSCLQTLTPDYVFNLSLEDVTLPGAALPSRSQTLTLGWAVPSGQILVYKALCEMSKDQLAGTPAEARRKAIGSVEAEGVTSAADYEAVNAVLGCIVSLVMNLSVMYVYYSMASVAVGTIPN